MSDGLFAAAVILAMGAAAYATRAGGVWMMGRVRLSPFAAAFLRHTPGTVLVALLAPLLMRGGIPEWAGASVTLLATLRTRNLLLSTALGTAAVWALRATLQGLP
jgi:uncharacterized membrane protein